jgi:hypothetical protein
MNGVDRMKDCYFQMIAFTDNQIALCQFFTGLRLIHYMERTDKGEVIAHIMNSPITDKPLAVWWLARCRPVIFEIFNWIWNRRFLYTDEAKRKRKQLLEAGLAEEIV